MRRLGVLLPILLVLGAVPALAQDVIYYVDAVNGSAGAAGTCDDAFDTLAEALGQAEIDADAGLVVEVRIAGGTLREANLFIEFSNITLKGGYDPGSLTNGCTDGGVEGSRDPTAFVTTIDGDLDGDGVGDDRILHVKANVDRTDPINPIWISANENIAIDGITFINGKPAVDNPDGGSGGALFVLNVNDVQITNSVFRGNQTTGHFFAGGALYFSGQNPYGLEDIFVPCNVTLENNLFENNATGTLFDPSAGSGPGGAVFGLDFNVDSDQVMPLTTLTAYGNTFRQNTSMTSPNLGVAGCPGGGLQNCDADPTTAEQCISRAAGGAMYLINVGGDIGNGTDPADPRRNVFEGNTSTGITGVAAHNTGVGGALFTLAFTPTALFGNNPAITNNLFQGNVARAGRGSYQGCGWNQAWGAGAYLANFDRELAYNEFDNNTADASLAQNGGQCAWGGGAFITTAGTQTSDPTRRARIHDNLFTSNTALGANSVLGGWGAGLFDTDPVSQGSVIPSDPVITNNVFDGNQATGFAAGGAYGGGLQIDTSGNYPVVARNLFVDNFAEGTCPLPNLCGNGGAIRMQVLTADALVADNVVVRNRSRSSLSTDLNPFPVFQFSGISLLGGRLNSPTRAPSLVNNLIADNDGTGVIVLGFATRDGNGNGVEREDPQDFATLGPRLLNNTIGNNDGVGILFNVGDQTYLENNLIFGNDAGGTLGNFDDDWLCSFPDGQGGCLSDRPTRELTALGNVLGVGPVPQFILDATGPPDPMGIAAAGNRFVSNAGWLDGANPDRTLRDYHLLQPPDEPDPAMLSPAVDRGSRPAPDVDYSTPLVSGFDLDEDGTLDTMLRRTTSAPTEVADTCAVDVGFHYDLSAPIVDTDGDGLPDDVEIALAARPGFECLDPNDDDSDDDGLIDGLDCEGRLADLTPGLLDLDEDGLFAQCDCDSDGDGLSDGIEAGMPAPAAGTDREPTTWLTCDTSNAPAGCGQADADPFPGGGDQDPTTTTDPLDEDSDDGGDFDGCEDVDGNGSRNGLESDPNNDADDDPDRDGIPNQVETTTTLTDPDDADTDDDGVADRDEAFPADLTDFSDPLRCDSDGDYLPDGLEHGVTDPVPDPDGPERCRRCGQPDELILGQRRGTDLVDLNGDPLLCRSIAAGDDADVLAFIAAQPADPAYRDTYAAEQVFADPLGRTTVGRDTDGDGCQDGEEDTNFNGLFEPGLGETDPTDETDFGECASSGLLISAPITAWGGPADPDCGAGPPSTPSLAGLLDARGAGCMPVFDGGPPPCPDARVDVQAPGAVQDSAYLSGDRRPGEALAQGHLLRLYELSGCATTLHVTKDGSDLIVWDQ